MRYDPALVAYTAATERAMRSNPPPMWPAYEADPIACWRYLCRLYGHGLGIFPEAQVHDLVKALYGTWFVKIEFRGKKMPAIDNAQFISWILDARTETIVRKQPELFQGEP